MPSRFIDTALFAPNLQTQRESSDSSDSKFDLLYDEFCLISDVMNYYVCYVTSCVELVT